MYKYRWNNPLIGSPLILISWDIQVLAWCWYWYSYVTTAHQKYPSQHRPRKSRKPVAPFNVLAVIVAGGFWIVITRRGHKATVQAASLVAKSNGIFFSEMFFSCRKRSWKKNTRKKPWETHGSFHFLEVVITYIPICWECNTFVFSWVLGPKVCFGPRNNVLEKNMRFALACSFI